MSHPIACEHSYQYPINPGRGECVLSSSYEIHWKCGDCHQIIRPASVAEVERIGRCDYRRDEEMSSK
jgi:hypothetical protein